MLIAQLSDTHIAGNNKKAYGVVPTALNLRACVENINKLVPLPDLSIITGDITYNGKQEEAQCAVDILNKLHCPYFIVPGNHDNNSTLLSAFGHSPCPTVDNTFIHYVIDGYDIRLIAMDSTRIDESGGKLCKKRLDWLQEQLAVEKTVPTVIFMHHPPAKCGVIESDIDGFIGAGKLGKLLLQYNNIKKIICGHIHMPVHLDWCGTSISTAPSMGMGIVLDLTLERPSGFVKEAPAYHLHYLNSENNLVTHLVTVSEKDGPYQFNETPEINNN